MSSTSLRSQLAKPWAHERSLTVVLIFLLINVVLIYPLSVAGITGHLVFGNVGFGLGAGVGRRRHHAQQPWCWWPSPSSR